LPEAERDKKGVFLIGIKLYLCMMSESFRGMQYNIVPIVSYNIKLKFVKRLHFMLNVFTTRKFFQWLKKILHKIDANIKHIGSRS
jgi:hypothetical protein